MQHSSVIWLNKRFSSSIFVFFQACTLQNHFVIFSSMQRHNLTSWEFQSDCFEFNNLTNYSSCRFALNLRGGQWSCDTCWTYTMMSVNISSSGSHIVRPEAEELPCQSGAQMWNLIEVGTRCRRRWAPAKARPGIHHTLPSKACSYNREQMSACLCSAPLTRYVLLFFKRKSWRRIKITFSFFSLWCICCSIGEIFFL